MRSHALGGSHVSSIPSGPQLEHEQRPRSRLMSTSYSRKLRNSMYYADSNYSLKSPWGRWQDGPARCIRRELLRPPCRNGGAAEGEKHVPGALQLQGTGHRRYSGPMTRLRGLRIARTPMPAREAITAIMRKKLSFGIFSQYEPKKPAA